MENFESSEKVLSHIRDRADDIECVHINTAQFVKRENGRLVGGVGAIVRYSDGTPLLIHYVDAELLLNDGLLNRLRIPIRFLREAESTNG